RDVQRHGEDGGGIGGGDDHLEDVDRSGPGRGEAGGGRPGGAAVEGDVGAAHQADQRVVEVRGVEGGAVEEEAAAGNARPDGLEAVPAVGGLPQGAAVAHAQRVGVR